MLTGQAPEQEHDRPRAAPAAHVPPDSVLVTGECVDGRWRLERCLASGADDALWLARDERLDREVALRFVGAHMLADEDDRALVAREAALLARVEHQNVVCLFDILEDATGLYFVTEYVEGRSLQELCDHPTRCPDQVVAAVGLQLARGLRAVHEQNVIHHDLRSDNVRILPNGVVKLLNFGSATGYTSADRTTSAMDPAAYLAPEQFEGARVDHRVDLYSLGLLLWELSAGVRPFPEHSTAATVQTRLIAEPATLKSVHRRVSTRLSAVIERATRRWPEQRWQSAAELEEALTNLCGHRPELLVQAHLAKTGLA